MEIDGPEGSFSDQFTLNNITLVGYNDAEGGEYADYRSNAMGASNNVAAYNFFAGKDIELDNDGVANNYNAGLLTFGAWEIEVPEGDSIEAIFNNKAENVSVEGFGSTASNVAAGSQTVGCACIRNLLNSVFGGTCEGVHANTTFLFSSFRSI